MAKSYKLADGNYIDSTGIVHNKTKLSDILTYSIDEKIIGTWIDRKPIYQKVLVGPAVTAGSLGIVPFSSDNLAEILDAYGFGIASNGNWFPLSRAHKDSFNFQSSYYYNYQNSQFEIETGTNILFSKTYIIVRYTKTTD